MRNLSYILKVLMMAAVIFALNMVAFSQSDRISSKIRWKFYADRAEKVYFLSSKLPVVVEEQTACSGLKTKVYGNYSEGRGYMVKVVRKTKLPEICLQNPDFKQDSFSKKLDEISKEYGTEVVTKRIKTPSKETIDFQSENRISKLIFDKALERWIELHVWGEDLKNSRVENFLRTAKFGVRKDASEVGPGADRTVGEKIQQDAERIVAGQANNLKSYSLRLIVKPRPAYTEQARKSNVQGKVVLRVIFMADGGIGDISVVEGLSDGLTEKAIAAAKKMVFIPAQRNGAKFSVYKIVEYYFTIF